MSNALVATRLHPIIVARMIASGRTVAEVANELNVPVANVRALTRSQPFKKLVALVRAALRKESPPQHADIVSAMSQLVPVALLTIEDIINDPLSPHSTRLEAAKTILDRTGFPPHQRINVTSTNIIDDDTLSRIRIRAREIVCSIPTAMFETQQKPQEVEYNENNDA